MVDNLVPEYGGNIYNVSGIEDRVTINISDVRDEYSMRHLVQGQDYIFNLAGQTSHLDSMHKPFVDLDINARAQLSILEACRHNNPDVKIVYASTRQIYGRPVYLPVDELHPIQPVDVNGINKLAGEWFHILYYNVYNIRSCVLRLTNTYGPGMRIKDARQTFLGIWVKKLIEGEPFEIWEGQQIRDFNYVSDVVDAFLKAAENPIADGQIFNLGGEEPINLQNLGDILIELNPGGVYSRMSFPNERKRIDIGDFYSDYQKISRMLGWVPSTPLREGLKKTLSYYQEHVIHYL